MGNFLTVFNKFTRWIDNAGQVLVGVLIFTMTFTTALQVFCRYIIGAALYWPEELNLVLMPWIVFPGAALAVRRLAHIKITIAVNMFSPKLRRIIYSIGYIAIAFFLLVFTEAAFNLAIENMDSRSEMLHIPLVLPQIAMTVGGVLMLIQLIWLIVRNPVNTQE